MENYSVYIYKSASYMFNKFNAYHISDQTVLFKFNADITKVYNWT